MTYTSPHVCLGGPLDSAHTTTGKLAWFNIWNSEMDQTSLSLQLCDAEGDVTTWSSLLLNGNASGTESSFACGDEQPEDDPTGETTYPTITFITLQISRQLSKFLKLNQFYQSQ